MQIEFACEEEKQEEDEEEEVKQDEERKEPEEESKVAAADNQLNKAPSQDFENITGYKMTSNDTRHFLARNKILHSLAQSKK